MLLPFATGYRRKEERQWHIRVQSLVCSTTYATILFTICSRFSRYTKSCEVFRLYIYRRRFQYFFFSSLFRFWEKEEEKFVFARATQRFHSTEEENKWWNNEKQSVKSDSISYFYLFLFLRRIAVQCERSRECLPLSAFKSKAIQKLMKTNAEEWKRWQADK